MRTLIRATVTGACVLAVTVFACLLTLVWFAPDAHSAQPFILDISPHQVLHGSTLKPCATEDPQPGDKACIWNYGPVQTSNGEGLTFYWDMHRIVYVWPENPVRLSDGRWRWVDKDLRHFVKVGYDHVLSYSCMYRHAGDDWSVIRCANGTKHMVGW